MGKCQFREKFASIHADVIFEQGEDFTPVVISTEKSTTDQYYLRIVSFFD
jgi:hypothetical protein